ncbi:hypothetical protein D5F01_LYC04664 [Larimichthys crocea]|uniref:Uncharacterized protein n=1 Tax=Larimichthys crocea TaxID=215358 RepID=A0A6G0IWM2_LARCR|nr:hypothetical protein D5F01_LYC04664 [Larimichthys crocea]
MEVKVEDRGKVDDGGLKVEDRGDLRSASSGQQGLEEPAHVQLKLKKLQLQDERLSVIDRDNRLLASKLSDIVCSKGLVEHQNHYHLRSLNVNKRREELLLVSRQNQAIYQRITSRQSEYRRQLWLDDWERAERRRDDISRYPRGLWGRETEVAQEGEVCGCEWQRALDELPTPTQTRRTGRAETPEAPTKI